MRPTPHLGMSFLANRLRQVVNNIEHEASGAASLEWFDYRPAAAMVAPIPLTESFTGRELLFARNLLPGSLGREIIKLRSRRSLDSSSGGCA